MLLHLLSLLHDRLLHAGSTMLVSLLSATSLQNALPEGFVASAATSAAHASPLRFSSAAGAPSPISLQWCTDWSQLVASAVPLRAIFLPSLFWLATEGNGCCLDDKQVARLTHLLDSLKIKLWPPPSWVQLLERKDRVYSVFNKYMLSSEFMLLERVGGDLSKIKQAFLQWCTRQGKGCCCIKGVQSALGICVAQLSLKQGKFVEDVDAMLCDFVNKHHQAGVGVQQFMPGMDKFEIRTWLVWDPLSSPAKWRSVLSLKTSKAHDEMMHSEQLQPIHGPALHIANLIDTMLEAKADFFTRLHDELQMTALRMDCGFDDALQRPFFSEFAVAGDGALFTGTHQQDLAYKIGRDMGERVWNLMRE